MTKSLKLKKILNFGVPPNGGGEDDAANPGSSPAAKTPQTAPPPPAAQFRGESTTRHAHAWFLQDPELGLILCRPGQIELFYGVSDDFLQAYYYMARPLSSRGWVAQDAAACGESRSRNPDSRRPVDHELGLIQSRKDHLSCALF
jgi:hypothetical protein